jgi:DNA-binding transcriptional MocR family regulator
MSGIQKDLPGADASKGFFLSHIKRMRKIYSERRDFFIEQFNKLLSDRFTLDVPETGLNIVAWLKREEDFEAVKRISVEIGVRPSPLSYFASRQGSDRRSCSVSLPGRRLRFGKALLNSHPHSRQREFNLELRSLTSLVHQTIFLSALRPVLL